MLRYWVIFTLNIVFICSKAQNDSVLVNDLNFLNEGLFNTHQEFRHNTSISKGNIVTTIDKEAIDFYNKLTGTEVIKYTQGTNTYTIESKKIWGYIQNKTLFLNYNGRFYRVPIFGAISYFAGIIEVTGYYNGVYDPMFGAAGGRAIKTNELSEFLMYYYNGKVSTFDMDVLDSILSKDEVVYKEFKSLSRRKRAKQASRFIRIYNERHPIYYLK